MREYQWLKKNVLEPGTNVHTTIVQASKLPITRVNTAGSGSKMHHWRIYVPVTHIVLHLSELKIGLRSSVPSEPKPGEERSVYTELYHWRIYVPVTHIVLHLSELKIGLPS